VRIGTRLTIVLLLALAPVVAAYNYWSVERSTRTYINDLKRETHSNMRGLASAIENDVRGNEWDEIKDIFQRVSKGSEVALFHKDGTAWYVVPPFPSGLVPASSQFDRTLTAGFVEFERTTGDRRWYCRVVPLFGTQGHDHIGYLLVAQDWTDISEDLRARTIVSAVAALTLLLGMATVIPLAVRRYVSGPLAELSGRVMSFSKDDEPGRGLEGDEVELLTEEFRKLDAQLTKARADLLERHRRELELERRLQHAERLATIGTLASGLAHEIGTPMGVIRARAELLLRRKPTLAKAQEGLETIISQIDRISRIVRMLLDYASNRQSMRVLCDARLVVDRALALLETEADRREVTVIKDLGEQPLTFECDPDQLQQVFINLAVNALDAMVPMGGTLRVTARPNANDHNSRLTITFEDTGHGISPQHRVRVFDPFFTTKEPGKGTGMGLAVSQAILRDHEGDITFDTTRSGTRFFVTIPGKQANCTFDDSARISTSE
jgi:two-component system NtrC family sensor kinase